MLTKGIQAIEDLLAVKRGPGVLRVSTALALDGVEDIISARCSAPPMVPASTASSCPSAAPLPSPPTVAKTSAGASEHVRIARVTNLVRSLEQMKQANVWVLGLDERGTPDYTDFDFRTDCVLVLGREGAGLHDLVKKTCDHLLRIPMAGRSLRSTSPSPAPVGHVRSHAPAPPAACLKTVAPPTATCTRLGS